jgi:vacuolar-type H+-ATPase subunit F/Vma7
MTKTQKKVGLYYIGGPGSSFGFKLAGIETITSTSGEEVLAQVNKIISLGNTSIVFIDEGLIEGVQEDLNAVTDSAVCSVVLLPNPTSPKRLAAKQMDRLMIQAVGSDIFNK